MLAPTTTLVPLRFTLAALLAVATLAPAQTVSTNAPTERTNAVTSPTSSGRSSSRDIIARIRDEGLNRSQITNTLFQLTEVIGPRLTASPGFKRSAEWTRQQMESWGLTNSHLESWGPFGRGWTLQRFSAQIVEPQTIPLIGQPFAWSPGLTGPITADLVFIDAKTETDLEKYRGQLKGVIALVSSPRELRLRTEPDFHRLTDANLLQLANLGAGRAPFFSATPAPTSPPSTNTPPSGRRADLGNADTARGTNSPSSARTNAPASRTMSTAQRLAFAHREGAAAVVTVSGRGHGGTFHVEAASVPGSTRSARGTNASNRGPGSRSAAVWATNAPAMPPQVQLMAEDYNRLARMLQQGEDLRMNLDLQVQFHDDDPLGYNVIAEMPGGDLQDEIVMLGGHLDSWHAGTGATDNAAGVAVAMEAMRILQAVKAKPRRTVRVALWGGEEQGLLGSKAHASRHFGYYTNVTAATATNTNTATNTVTNTATIPIVANTSTSNTNTTTDATNTVRSAREDRGRPNSGTATNRSGQATRTLVRHSDYDNFSVYFNLDNGTGRIRGVYLQGNEAARPLFRKWLDPFRDLGAETLTLGETSATDHLSFDTIGLPGFQFIQDPVEYFSRTHHSNMDVYDRLQIEDLKQAATVMAACVYQAAMSDEKLPRKPPAAR